MLFYFLEDPSDSNNNVENYLVRVKTMKES